MVKSYLRHEPTAAFGLICSPEAARATHLDADAKTALVPALEDVLVWDVKRGVQLASWHQLGHRSKVTAIARAPANGAAVAARNLFAVGYQDGSVRLWDAHTATVRLTFNGHRGAVTCLAFDPDASRLASAGQDTHIILWDIVAESGLFRLRGHRNAVTDLAFVGGGPSSALASSSASSSAALDGGASVGGGGHLASVSKDGLLKLWDLSLQHCIDTAVPGKGELCSLAVADDVQMDLVTTTATTSNDDEQHGSGRRGILLLTGSSEGEVRIWEIRPEVLAAGLQAQQLQQQQQPQQHQAHAADVGTTSSPRSSFFIPHGPLPLAPPSGKRVTQIAFGHSPSRRRGAAPEFVGVLSSERALQVFRLRTADDVRKKMARRRRRLKEKSEKRRLKRQQQQADSAAADDGEQQEVEGAEVDEGGRVAWSDRLEPYTLVRPAATGARIKGFSFAAPRHAAPDSLDAVSQGYDAPTSLLLSLGSNALEVHSVPAPPRTKADKAALTGGNAVVGEAGGKAMVEAKLSCGLDLPGHRSEVRALALSSDDALLASADSSGQLKVWNLATGRVLRTLACGYALCCAWLSDDRHVVVGCKDGTLRSYDVPAGEALEVVEAHAGPVWSLAVRPDGGGIATGSADKDVKFWEVEMRVPEAEQGDEEEGEEAENDADEDGMDGHSRDKARGAPARTSSPPPRPPPPTRAPGRPRLQLRHVKTLRMTDDVLCVRYSPDARLLALSLLDSTVKVFYADSLKFFLSLYGHKLPVLSLDISADSKLCVTASADRNVKLWGLDFGDCHRSLFAHDDAVMGVAFERGRQGGGLLGGREGASHHFWSVGRDARVRHWDGDRFELIQTLEGHHGEVWAVAAGGRGTVAVTAGADRSLRVWEKTEEPLFLEEERERELERLYEGDDDNDAEEGRGRDGGEGAIGSLARQGATGLVDHEDGRTGAESGGVTKSTRQTLMAGERLIEALDLALADREAQREYQHELQRRGGGVAGASTLGAPPPRHPLLAAAAARQRQDSVGDEADEFDAHRYVLGVAEGISAAQLEDALLVLPFDRVVALMECLDHWARKEWNLSLTARVLFFLLRTHHDQLVANEVMRTTLTSLRGHLRAALRRQKTTIGFNLAALRHVRSRLVARRTARLSPTLGLGDDDDDDGRDARRSDGVLQERRKRKLVLTSS